MAHHLIVLKASPRPNSNSARLMQEGIAGAEEAGATTEVIDLAKSGLRPCIACESCVKTGRCIFNDDGCMDIMDKVTESGRLLVASPIYYMAAPAQLKCFIDRTQCLYNKKYKMKVRLSKEELSSRRGGVLAVCGSGVSKAFDGFGLTMKYFFDSLQIPIVGSVYAERIDAAGEIERCGDILARARELGKQLAGD